MYISRHFTKSIQFYLYSPLLQISAEMYLFLNVMLRVWLIVITLLYIIISDSAARVKGGEMSM